MSKPVVSLCLYDVDTANTDVTISIVTAPFNTPPAYTCTYYYYDSNGNKVMGRSIGTEDYTNVALDLGENYEVTLPTTTWNHGSDRFFIATANASSSDTITAPPLMLRSDNAVIVIVEENLDAIPDSVLGVQAFTNLTPNANGCITLDIRLTENPASNLNAVVYYYIPNVESLIGKVVTQTFPIKYVENNHFRLGFKTFYGETQGDESFSLDTLPIVWVAFTED